jgi:hypothetical protein
MVALFCHLPAALMGKTPVGKKPASAKACTSVIDGLKQIYFVKVRRQGASSDGLGKLSWSRYVAHSCQDSLARRTYTFCFQVTQVEGLAQVAR